MTEFYRDALEEAQALKVTIEARQKPTTAADMAETRALLARFRRLQAVLRGEEYVPEPDALARDVEAQARGELPEFVARKLEAHRAGTARILKEMPETVGKAARMMGDRATIQSRTPGEGPRGRSFPQRRK